MKLDVKQIKKDVKKTGLFGTGYSALVLLGTPLTYKIEQFLPESQRVLTSPYAWETFKTDPGATLFLGPFILVFSIVLLSTPAFQIAMRYTTGDSE